MSNFRDLVDLAGERLGGSVVYANDDFFAPKENLIKPSTPVWKEHEYTDRGKWMDGWESRRRRTPGNDFAIIRLGARGVVKGVVVDTSFFRGNYPDAFSLDGVSVTSLATTDALLATEWHPMLGQTKLKGDSENAFEVHAPFAVTHVRLNIFPDGGVARLRVHGEPAPDWHRGGGLASEVDLAAIENGGAVLACSDMFFGPKDNLIMPGRALNMSDGWETKRRRGTGYDWVTVRLATEGMIHRIEVDTNHFKGNYPDTASIEGSADGKEWVEVVPRTKMQPDARHVFVDEIVQSGPFTQLRLNVFPDGGVSRMRVWGRATESGRRAAAVCFINTLVHPERDLRSCCAAPEWVAAMVEARPFPDWNTLVKTSDRIWSGLKPDQWMHAFDAHPRIGEKKDAARWSADEQSGTRAASPQTIEELAKRNREYEHKFGHVFLICATGRSADEILANLKLRMNNDAATELKIGAEEQRRITALRLEKLVL